MRPTRGSYPSSDHPASDLAPPPPDPGPGTSRDDRIAALERYCQQCRTWIGLTPQPETEPA